MPPDVAAALRETTAAMMVAFAAGAPARVGEHYTADAVLVAPGVQTVGRAAIARVWGAVPPGRRWRLELTEVGGAPAEPWTRGRSHLAWTDSTGAARSRSSEVFAVWRRQPDGRYLIHRDVMLPAPR